MHATSVQTQRMRVHTKAVSAVAFFKGGRRVVTASKDKTLRIWNAVKMESVGGTFEGHSDYVDSVAVSPDDRQIASGGGDGIIIIWDVDSKQKALVVKHEDRVKSLCFSPDGKRLASGSLDGTVIIWHVKTGAVLSMLVKDRGHSPSVFCVAFSPDGLKLASGTRRYIRVWSTDTADLLFDISAHDDWVQNVV
jgi:WD40 repeat protein